MQSVLYPGSRKPRPLAADECANFGPGCRPAWELVRCHGFCPWGSTVALGWLVLGGPGLGARGSCRNRLNQDIGLAGHVPHERPHRTSVCEAAYAGPLSLSHSTLWGE
jgi:hypothetical protein